MRLPCSRRPSTRVVLTLLPPRRLRPPVPPFSTLAKARGDEHFLFFPPILVNRNGAVLTRCTENSDSHILETMWGHTLLWTLWGPLSTSCYQTKTAVGLGSLQNTVDNWSLIITEAEYKALRYSKAGSWVHTVKTCKKRANGSGPQKRVNRSGPLIPTRS